MSKITGGEVKYGRTMKTGDFENKRVDVALSFTVEDGEDHAAILQAAAKEAHGMAHSMLGIKQIGAVVETNTPRAGEPAEQTAARTAQAERTNTKEAAAAAMNGKDGKDKPPKEPKAPKAEKPAAAAAESFEGFDEDAAESQPEITDAAMSAAMNKKVGELKVVHAGAAPKLVKELINKFVEPPKKSHDIPQNLRAEFLKKLEALV